MIEAIRDIQEQQFVIPGACPPKGSRVPVGKGRATRESSDRVAPWTKGAVEVLRLQRADTFEGPVYVQALFSFEHPEKTESVFPVAPTIGDTDKLLRCLCDALTKAGVIVDDRYAVQVSGAKVWGHADQTVVRVGRVLTERERLIDHTECRLVLMNCGMPGCPVRVPPVG